MMSHSNPGPHRQSVLLQFAPFFSTLLKPYEFFVNCWPRRWVQFWGKEFGMTKYIFNSPWWVSLSGEFHLPTRGDQIARALREVMIGIIRRVVEHVEFADLVILAHSHTAYMNLVHAVAWINCDFMVKFCRKPHSVLYSAAAKVGVYMKRPLVIPLGRDLRLNQSFVGTARSSGFIWRNH